MTDAKPIDFLCVGAEKSGTTWLADVLRQHPDIYIPPIKEVHYFNAKQMAYPRLDNPQHRRSLGWYHAYFRQARPQQLRGECSVSYFTCPPAARRIAEYNPRMRILVLLRNPVDRLFSQFRAYLARGILPQCDLQQALRQRPDLIERSRYVPHLKRFRDLFPSDQVHVMFFDDILARPDTLIEEVHAFLGLEPHRPDRIRHKSNLTTRPRSALLSRALEHVYRIAQQVAHPRLLDLSARLGLSGSFTRLRRMNMSATPVPDRLPMAQRLELFAQFEPDIDELEAIFKRDLSTWRPHSTP